MNKNNFLDDSTLTVLVRHLSEHLKDVQSLHLTIVQAGATNIQNVEHYHGSDILSKQDNGVFTCEAGNTQDEYEQSEEAIMEYVGRLTHLVAPQWQEIYLPLWHDIIAMPSVSAVIYNPGKQVGTTFNRNLVAHIIHIMGMRGAFGPRFNAQKLTMSLEGNKSHSVRVQLGLSIADSSLRNDITRLITSKF